MTPKQSPQSANRIDFSEERYVDKDGNPQSKGLISLFNPDHISAILCHYSALKLASRGKYTTDLYYLMEDFDNLLKRALDPYPIYLDIVNWKIDGLTNV